VGVWTSEGGFTLWWKGDDEWLIEPSESEEPDEARAVPLTKELFLEKMVQVLGT
jgi:hypothetical protein